MSRPAENARLARRAKHHRVHRIVEFDGPPGLGHLLAHRPVERVERVRPVQRDGGDVVGGVDVEQDRLERRHRHCQFGCRFSMNAFGPSSGVLGAHDPLTEGLGEDLGLVQRQVERLVDGQPGAPNRQRRIRVHDVGDLVSALEQAVVLDDLADHAEFVGALGAHPLVLAHQRHSQRDVARQHPGQPHHLAAGHQADADMRVEEGGLVGGDHDVAGGDPVEPRAAAQSVDRGQDRFGHRAKRRGALLRRLPLVVGGQVGPFVDDLAVLGDLRDVGAGAESPAVAGHDQNPDVVVVLGFVICGAQFGDHVRAERVECVRAIERDRRRVPVDLVFDVVEDCGIWSLPSVIGHRTPVCASRGTPPGPL